MYIIPMLILFFVMGYGFAKVRVKTDGFIVIDKAEDEETCAITFGLKEIPKKKYIILEVEHKEDVP